MKENIFFAVIVAILILNAYITGKPSCHNYILNTYLFIILGFLLILISIDVQEKRKNMRINPMASLIAAFGLLIAIQLLPSKMFKLKIVTWLGFIFFISTFLYNFYEMNKNNPIFQGVLYTCITIIILMTTIGIYKPHLILLQPKNIIATMVMSAILLEIVTFLVDKPQKNRKIISNILAYAITILFSLFMLYDTRALLHNARICKIADYPRESLGMLLDFIKLN